MIVRAGALDMAHDDVGAGAPVLLVHGFPMNRAMWAPQTTALVDRMRCIAPDLRGFGESAIGGPYSMDQYADDLAALLDALHIERIVVAGLSMGGYIAFALWRRHRERVRALVLADTRAGADSDETREKRRAMIAMAQEKGASAVADAMMPGLLGKKSREKCPELADSLHRMLESAPVPGIIGALEAMIARPDSTPMLATIDIPTLIVVGDEDALTPVKESLVMHEAIRGSHLEILAGAGHVSNLERPAGFNHVVAEFVAGLDYT